MANLFFPQLSTGALAQYPIRKARVCRTVENVLIDGSFIPFPDPNANCLVWELGYTGLSQADVALLSDHFSACAGRFRPFVFIDPRGNMLANSSDLTTGSWTADPLVQVRSSAPDPFGGNTGFIVTNNGQATQQIAQTVGAPTGFQYCFSVYAFSLQPLSVDLLRTGPSTLAVTTAAIGPVWSRVISSGQLAEAGETLTVSIRLTPGQQIYLYGPQLEAQTIPSAYIATLEAGGVYPNAHWGVDELPIRADAPSLYSTAFTIESTVL